MTGYSTIQSAITAIQNRAKDYLEKPFDDLDEAWKYQANDKGYDLTPF
ncbi:hypothetical protein [Ammoniphilus sp. 3BR4]